MADHNTTHSATNFYSEVLTPAELFAARSRSHKIPVRGQKDFIPDDSEEQRQRLEQALNEHWSLVSEERVERLGSLVKGVWIPEEQLVELQSPAGKFWQTMGFSVNGKQCLLPEEALFLMECGNVQVFFHDLPLSIQDGYERLLPSNSVGFLQYLVYGHLKRLGYVVHRFDPSSQPSAYTRQLNLPLPRDRAGRPLKRKRSPSPTSARKSQTVAESTLKLSESAGESSRAPLSAEVEPMEEGSEVKPRPMSWWTSEEVSMETSESESRSGSESRSSRWDFSCVLFPDVGSAVNPSLSLAAPDPSLLPGTVSVGPCDIASWRQRINLKEVKMSPKERKREEDTDRRQVDPEVQRCRSWAEYRALMAKRQATVKARPAHLWDREVTPLHDPSQTLPHEELLEKISIIKPAHLLDGASGTNPRDDWRISFSVFQPDSVSGFKKSSPGKPYARMVVCSFDGPVPNLDVLKQLSSQSPDVPLVFAAVDHGDISFYTFKDFHLPRDVFP